jgi:hypothetical protein
LHVCIRTDRLAKCNGISCKTSLHQSTMFLKTVKFPFLCSIVIEVLCDHSDYTWQRVQVIQFLIMQFSPTSCHFITLLSKYSHHHPYTLSLSYKQKILNYIRSKCTKKISWILCGTAEVEYILSPSVCTEEKTPLHCTNKYFCFYGQIYQLRFMITEACIICRLAVVSNIPG